MKFHAQGCLTDEEYAQGCIATSVSYFLGDFKKWRDNMDTRNWGKGCKGGKKKGGKKK